MVPDEIFPFYDGGKVVFQRDWFIQKTSKFVLTKSSTKYGSYYWSSPVGSGKTVFLKLLGRKLQNHGCQVYLTIANTFCLFSNGSKVAKDAGDKTVVLLIDGVHTDMKSFHWNALLKGSKPDNVLVIGVGVPQLVQQ